MLDAVSHPIACAHCGHRSEKSLGWLTEHPEFPCPGGCGATIRVLVSDFAAAQRGAAPSEDLDLDTWRPKPSE